MARKSFKPEEIISKLREADLLISGGKSIAETIKHLCVNEVTYYRWRKEYGGMGTSQMKRRTCRVLHRSVQRYQAVPKDDEAVLTQTITLLTLQ